MKHLFRIVIALYPAHWRQRYEAEMMALIEDSGYRAKDLANLLLSAVGAHVRSPILLYSWVFSGLLFGTAMLWVVPQHYKASVEAQLKLEPATVSSMMSHEGLGFLIQAYGLYPRWQNTRSLDEVITQMRTRDVQIEALPGSRVRVAFTHPDPKVATDVARDLAIELGFGASPSPVLQPLYKVWLLVVAGLIVGTSAGFWLQRFVRIT